MSEPTTRSIILSGEERLVVCHFLASVPWAGNEAQLDQLQEVYEAFGCAELPAPLPSGQFVAQKDFDPTVLAETKISPLVRAFLSSNLPPAQTPGILGPAKLRLLRKLRTL